MKELKCIVEFPAFRLVNCTIACRSLLQDAIWWLNIKSVEHFIAKLQITNWIGTKPMENILLANTVFYSLYQIIGIQQFSIANAYAAEAETEADAT